MSPRIGAAHSCGVAVGLGPCASGSGSGFGARTPAAPACRSRPGRRCRRLGRLMARRSPDLRCSTRRLDPIGGAVVADRLQ